MAASSDSDEDETFVSIGNPLEVPDKDEPRKKPVAIQDIQAKDSKGRARFHGAFTGGFSAGYFNSVGSKEGWTPSTFVSSRNKRPEPAEKQKPEDFMDEDDVGEYGIAPRKFVTAASFSSEERKRRRHDEAKFATSDSILPGHSALLDLITPERITIGMKLLRKMGWRDGQGVGPRVSRKQKRKQKAGMKIYGCEMPLSPDSDEDDGNIDDDSFLKDITYAPKDTAHIFLSAKDNTHGIGYRGINPHLALGSSSSGHFNLFEPPRITKKGRKGIRGQGFGVGALEEDDEDIYALDDMSRYDMTMGGDEEDNNFGWTAPRGKGKGETPVGYVGQMLEGFHLSSNKLIQKKDFPPPQLPRNYRPVHKFIKSEEEAPSVLSMGPKEGIDYRQFLHPQSEDVSPSYTEAELQPKPAHASQKYKDAASRSIALGEKAFVGSVFDLISLSDKSKLEAAKAGKDVSKPGTSGRDVPAEPRLEETGGEQTQVAETSKKKIKETAGGVSGKDQRPKPGTASFEELRRDSVPLFKGAVEGFKPFLKDPAKQQRYELYQELVKHGNKDPFSVIVTDGQTEWEIEREREEFSRAVKLYRPLSNMMAMRFTTGKQTDNDKDVDVKVTETIDKTDAEKAAEMKMYGKLTRDILEWHPDRLLCKRFNVPDPYPGSSIVGLATVKRDKYSVFNFLNFSTPADMAFQQAAELSSDNTEKEVPKGESESRVDKELNKSKNMKSIFSHLMEPEKVVPKSAKSVSFTVKSSTKTNKPKEFKSIFSHLDDEGKNRPKLPVMETESTDGTNLSVDGAKKVSEPSPNAAGDIRDAKKKKKEDTKESDTDDDRPPEDLFRAIFKNTDSEDSSSSDDEAAADDDAMEVTQDAASSVITTEVSKSINSVNSPSAKEGKAGNQPMQIEIEDEETNENQSKSGTLGSLPGSNQKIESLEQRLSPPDDSDDSEAFGPALPPTLTAGASSTSHTETAYIKSSREGYIDLTKESSREGYIDLTKESSREGYIDLTKESSRKHKHKHKEKHKSKKDKKEKHKKSKHRKKKSKKKEKKKERKYDSDTTDTSDKDSDSDSEPLPSDREILDRLKSIKPGTRMRAGDFL